MARDLHEHTHGAEIECSADKFWNLFRHNITNLPKVMPSVYKSVEILEGDEVKVGSILLFKYFVGDDPTVHTAKERVEAVDDENRSFTLRILEGDHILEHYENFAIKLSVTPKGDGCMVSWCLEHEKKHEKSPPPHSYLDLFKNVTSHCGDHVHKARDLHEHTHGAEIECSADRFWNLFRHNITDLPKVMPSVYKSVEILEGDEVKVGSILLFKYFIGDDPTVHTAKERVEAVDDENRSFTLRILEGDHILEHYEDFAIKLSVIPKGEGSMVSWSLEHEKKLKTSPPPHSYLELFKNVTSHCGDHVNKA